MRKCGFHVQATSPHLREAILAVKPAVIASLAHDRDFWWDIKHELPGVFLIGRRYEEDRDWRQIDPRWWADQCAALEMPYDAYITWNEPTDVYNEITMELAKQHDDWCCRFRDRILSLGYDAVALNIPTGHFHRNAVANLFPNVCQTFQYIGLHEYSARAMWDQDPKKQRPPEEVPKNEGYKIGHWYCQRYRDWYDGIVARWPERAGKFQIVVTECGVAYGVMEAGYGDVGWQTDLSMDDYLESLRWYFGEMNQDGYCMGGAIFMMGFADHKWASFDTLPYWEWLLEIPETGEPEPEPEPPPENGGEMDIKIYDFDHSPGPDSPTVDWDWVRDTFGDVRVLPIEEKDGLTLQEGDVVYKLVYLDARLGDANIIINVRDDDGVPVQGETVMFGWPDAPAHNYPDYVANWTEIGIPGQTNENGDIGPGLGPGAYYSPAEGERGPHWIWVYGLPSDYVDGLGMLPGTNHAHLNLGYRAVVVDEEPPENGGKKGMWIETDRSYDASAPSGIVLHLSGGNMYDTRGDMKCGTWRLEEPLNPEGEKFIFDTTYLEEEDRTYVAWVYRIPGTERVSDEVACDFGPGKRGTYHVRLTWEEDGNGDEPEPGPGPTPEPSDVGAFIAGVKEAVGQDVMTAEMNHGDGWKFSFYEGRLD